MKHFNFKINIIAVVFFISIFVINSKQTFSQTCAVNAGNDVTITCGGSVILNVATNNEWMVQTSPVSSELNCVFFPDSNIGYISGFSGKILKTTDGGVNWITQTSGTMKNLASIYFVNSNIGYCVGSMGEIRKTSNGGTLWSQQTSNTITFLRAVYFLNADTGFAVGMAGKIIKTVNGGLNWNNITSNTIDDLNSIFFVNTTLGYISGKYGKVLKTTDGGNSWTALTTPIFPPFNSIYFTSVDTGYAVGMLGKIIKTIDGGTNWTQQQSGLLYGLNSVIFLDKNIGYAVGDTGSLIKTVDGGTNWNSQFSSASAFSSFNSIYFFNKNHGYIVGKNGLILKHVDDNTFSWSPTAGLSNSNVRNPVVSPAQNTTYTVTVTFPGGCTATDAVNVSITSNLAPDICITFVDTILNKNKIVWEKPVNATNIISYKIYKEGTIIGNYTLIATIPYSQLSEYVDTSSQPRIRSDRYKLSYIDNCGTESALSANHRTLRLAVTPNVLGNGFNLNWFNLSEGFTFTHYIIYRRTSNTTFAKIDSVTNIVTSYTDTTPLTGRLYYYIAVRKSSPCTSTGQKAVGGPYSQSISNPEDNGIFNQGIQTLDNSDTNLKIYPNPFTDKTTIFINVNDLSSGYNLKIIDITGKTVKEINSIKSNTISIEKGNLSSGIYTVEIKGKQLLRGKLIIK